MHYSLRNKTTISSKIWINSNIIRILKIRILKSTYQAQTSKFRLYCSCSPLIQQAPSITNQCSQRKHPVLSYMAFFLLHINYILRLPSKVGRFINWYNHRLHLRVKNTKINLEFSLLFITQAGKLPVEGAQKGE